MFKNFYNILVKFKDHKQVYYIDKSLQLYVKHSKLEYNVDIAVYILYEQFLK